jgi:hypothetical protein
MVGKVEDEQYVSVEEASSVMGKNFFGINHACEFFDFDLSSEKYQGLDFNKIHYSKEILIQYQHTHFLIFLSPVSINRMKSMYPSVFNKTENFFRSAFAQKEGELGWFLIEKKPKENLFSKQFAEQLLSVAPNENIISAQGLVYFLLANFLLNNECILFDSVARCPDIHFLDFRVCVGNFNIDLGGISVSNFWDTGKRRNLSIMTFLKENM